MSLETYKDKRKFENTPEPTGGKTKAGSLVFVVQKHQASHLHYDFRLEMKGVLKSWAVPKGPSLNPEDKRLAQLVEDHPFDYKNFEGIIPEGNYGAGTVIIWDHGTYEPAKRTGRKEEDEKALLRDFYAGKISIQLKGEKLKGRFTLVKTPARGDNAWLLAKAQDRYARKSEVTKKAASVVSGQTIEEMSGNPSAAQWKSNGSAAKKKDEEAIVIEAPEKIPDLKQLVSLIKRDFKKHPRTPMPRHLQPMEATLIEMAFDDPDYQFEIKWDGYRCIAYVNDGKISLRSKSDLDFNKNYPPVVEALKQWNINCVLDGEIVVLNDEGRAEFNALQNWPRTHEGHLFYHVFDLLWLDGIDLTHEPLSRRRSILKQLVPGNSIIRYSDSIDENGEAFFELAKKNELEGIIAKNKNSLYAPGTRSREWMKLPVEEIKEYVIVGYTESESGRPFSRIMFGNYHDDGKLYYVHHTGGGIADALAKKTYATLKKIETKKKPVVNDAGEDTPVHWVAPKLVGRFKEKSLKQTPSGKKRHPVIFLGIREDIRPADVTEAKEEQQAQKKAKSSHRMKPQKKSAHAFDPVAVWKNLHGKAPEQTESIEVEGKEMLLMNYQQEYWPGIPKLQLILYYQSIAGYILPYLCNRPLGLNVIDKWAGEKEAKFLRNMKGNYPAWVKIFTTQRKIPVEGKSEDIDWVVCNDLATLIYMVNLGAVDLHPWSARVDSSNEPDYIVIDLDPADVDAREKGRHHKGFQNAIKIALAAKEFFGETGLVSFIKTSGRTGLHLLLPCAGIEYGHTRTIAENICAAIHEKVPAISTLSTSVQNRKGKVYIDASQNDYGDRLAAPYCVRAYKQPYVSTPLSWEEVNIQLDRHAFTMEKMQERLDEKGDLFEGLFDKKIREANAKILTQFAGTVKK